jgi:ParB family chromosome partitioning protein
MAPPQELRELPVDLVEPNLAQPRRYFDQATLQELAGSLKERGVLQPVLVRPSADSRYELIAGERRWRAAKIAGLQSIPSLISPYDDLEALETALIENMARENLSPVEEARACTTLIKELGLTHQEIAHRVGRSRVAVSNLMRLLNLSTEILELLERGELSMTHGLTLLRARDTASHRELARRAVEEEWSVRTLQARADQSNNTTPNKNNAVLAQTQNSTEQAQDPTALNIATVWGDALGTEVHVHTLPHQLRVELLFDTPQGALALGKRITQAVTQDSKGK